jgi:hypothetical protein
MLHERRRSGFIALLDAFDTGYYIKCFFFHLSQPYYSGIEKEDKDEDDSVTPDISSSFGQQKENSPF